MRIFFIIIFLYSCQEIDKFPLDVITEDVLYISAEKFRVTGRLLNIPDKGIDDHGFQISTSENFSEFVLISLGKKNRVGKFIGDYFSLEPDKRYYCRSFIKTGEVIVTGNVVKFNTLLSFLKNFEPKIANPNDTITIRGSNFTKDTRVFLDDEELQVLSLELESIVKVKVPNTDTTIFKTISLTSSDLHLSFDEDFEYVSGKWQLETVFFDNNDYYESIYFLTEDEFVFGLGVGANFINNPNIWSLNMSSYTWSNTSYPGYSSRTAFFTKNIFGGGVYRYLPYPLPTVYSNEFQSYINQEYTYIDTLEFEIYKSICFNHSNQLYLLGGIIDHNEPTNRVYNYDFETKIWSEKKDVPKHLKYLNIENPSFLYNDILLVLVQELNQIYQYDIINETWDKFNDFPYPVGSNGLLYVIGSKLYVGLFDYHKSIWELDLDTREWKETIKYPLSAGDKNAAHFVYKNKIYVFKRKFVNNVKQGLPMELWSFEPNTL